MHPPLDHARMRYEKNNGLKVKPIDNGLSCIIFNRDARTLHQLNTVAWFILEICNQRSPDEIEKLVHDTGLTLQAHEILDCLCALKKIGAISIAP